MLKNGRSNVTAVEHDSYLEWCQWKTVQSSNEDSENSLSIYSVNLYHNLLNV